MSEGRLAVTSIQRNGGSHAGINASEAGVLNGVFEVRKSSEFQPATTALQLTGTDSR